MTYAQLRLLGSVQKQWGVGEGWAIEHFQCQTFFDPLHKSQNFLSPLNKSKNFLKPQNSAICCKIQCAKTVVLTFKWFKSNRKSWKVKNFVWLIGGPEVTHFLSLGKY